MFHLLYITNNPEVAVLAEKNGVDRIWLDLEKNGKEERQRGKDSVISNHTIKDVFNIRKVISKADLLVRINPWYEGSEREIEDVISAGADIIMLPMWKSCEEVENFQNVVRKRTKTILLLETKEALEIAINEVLEKGLADEIHFGLRDLSLSMEYNYIFTIYEKDILELTTMKIREKSIPFGIGGVGKFGVGFCPGPERLLIEDIRLGASSIILSRTFCNGVPGENNSMKQIDYSLKSGIKELKKWVEIGSRMSKDIFDYNRRELIHELQEERKCLI